MLVDNKGNFIDGDKILAIIAMDMKNAGKLSKNTVVATHMSNLGFERFLNKNGINLVRTEIGDKHVAATMKAGGFNLGGEQSGHIILSDFAPTGDGIVAALQILKHFIESGHSSVFEMFEVYDSLPQKLLNLKIESGNISAEFLQTLTRALTEELNGKGRVLIRKSGTEPLVRIMIEAETDELVA